jgi:undecaprenyl-diphosphatase
MIGRSNAAGRPQRLAEIARRTEARLLLGFLAITAAIAGFAALASEAREGDIFAVDRLLLLGFRRPGDLSTPVGPLWVEESARDITALGGLTVLALVSVFATAMLVLHGRRLQAVVFAIAVVFAQAASEVLKHLIARPRPMLVPHLDLISSASFPSGHAMMSPVVYLTLAVVLAAGAENRRVRVLLVGSAVLLVTAIGITRVYLGVHWPTDVIAGWMLGSAIALAACYALVRATAR